MTQQSRIHSLQNQNLRRRHICSLTNSEMLVLNLVQLQQMEIFRYDIVVTEQADNKIYAYRYNEHNNSYLLVVPLSLYNSIKYKCRSFVELLCLCSQTITIPLHNQMLDDFKDLLRDFGIDFKYKSGNSVYKIYMQGQCFVSYLDMVTFHAVQYKGKNSKQLIAMKKQNGYAFSLNLFKEESMPKIFESPQNKVQTILESSINSVHSIFDQLASQDRFSLVYDQLQQKSFTFADLQSQLKQLILSRHIATIADEQYEQIINQQLDILITQQINKYFNRLAMNNLKDEDEKSYYMIILDNIFKKMKKYHLEVNTEKFMFVSARLIEVFMEIKKEKNRQMHAFCENLMKRHDQQERQVASLKEEKQKMNNIHHLTVSRLNQLSMVQESKEKQLKTKQSTPLKDSGKYKKQPLTIQDLKEPLQIIPSNFSPQKLNKTLKNRKKSKQKLKKKDIDTKPSLKILRKF